VLLGSIPGAQRTDPASLQPAPGPSRLVLIVRPAVSDRDTLTPNHIVGRCIGWPDICGVRWLRPSLAERCQPDVRCDLAIHSICRSILHWM